MKKLTGIKIISLIGSLILILLITSNAKAQTPPSMYDNNWPEWRGRYNSGAAPTGNPPVEFSETKNIKWKTEIPGKGYATPIVWGDQIIVETSVPTDKMPGGGSTAAPSTGMGGASSPQATTIHKFLVISVDKNSGKINWQADVKDELPQERTHELGSWASNSPVTDGEYIYAYFGSRGLYCLDFKGNIIWSRDFGQMQKRMSFGEGSSPAMSKNKIFIQWDQEGQSYLYAIDKKTGKDAWVDKRDEATSWATPVVVEINGKTQVITAATKKVRSYDAETGDIVWECKCLTQNVIPCPTYADGIVYLMSGYQGTALKAIDLARAKGDITGTNAIIWSYDKDTPYTPSPLLMDGKLYFLRTNNGFLTCLDAKTGKVYYSKEKLDGIGTLYSSPTGANGKIYVAVSGVVDVVQAGPEFKLLSKNTLDDDFRASPVIVGNDLILRGFKNLYCFSDK